MEYKTNQNANLRQSRIRGFLLLAAGIILNLGLANLATRLSLPLFLDSLGTILTAAMGGYLPGIIVGFVSNLINGFVDATNSYYAVLNVLIAALSAYFAERGYFRTFWKALLVIFPLTIVGGLLGSIITYLIFGFGIGEGISSGLASVILGHTNLGIFFSQLSSDMLYDLIDKTVTVILAYLILKCIPDSVQESLQFHGWRQRPLTPDEKKATMNTVLSARSLRSKILGIIGVATIFIATITTAISFVLYRRATINDHMQLGIGASKLIETLVDGDRIDEFIRDGEKAPGYQQIEKEFERIRDTSNDILYVYVYRIQEDGCHVVFDLDTEDVPGGEPGEIIPFDESFMPYLDDLLAGKEIEPLETNDTFGWLLTMYEPIRDSAGVTQAYACVDISMEQVQLSQIEFLTKIFVLFFGFFIMIVAIGLWLADYNMILPINTMALAANQFAYQTEEAQQESVEHFKSLEIQTGDEIENLYHSFSITIENTVRYIADISKMQNGLILVLADMVESRDKCTGDHVRKTAAYCRIILDQLRRDGQFPDQLTDEFINDVVNSAPLHDIGKIKVSDTILNKPGKLTDEEFAEMKKHTLAGNDIIQEAMELVSTDTGYLKEAKNLATYHHEKWNGSGYPMGLKGDEIPLSARVMAVADVFDALVSQRSYKQPFTFEKAVSIIEEGSGSHFDPRIVQAFLEVKDQARVISETFMGHSGGLGQTGLIPKLNQNEKTA